MYPPKVILNKFNENMFIEMCDICGKEVLCRERIRVSYPATLSQYEFCEDCGVFIVGFLKEHGLVNEEKRLIRF